MLTSDIYDFSAGDRIQDSDGYRGTVRYKGPVASSKSLTDLWLGKFALWSENIYLPFAARNRVG